MGFIAVLILTTLAIAGSAAFFSIYGLAQIFTGSFWPVVIMASSLEAGKLVAASFLYRYWKKISWVMKTYLSTAVIVLMVITSAGIFGFLSAAYQQDILPTKLNEQKIALYEEEKAEVEQLKEERLERKKQIDADIASLPNNFVTGRQRLMESYGPELETLKEEIADYTKRTKELTLEISELKQVNLEKEAHVGPIIFIARVFDQDVDDTTKWLILIIIFAFDPLAVALTIGANMALIEMRGGKETLYANGKKKEDPNEPPLEPEVEEVSVVDEPSTPPAAHMGMSVEELEALLEKINAKNKELSPQEAAHRELVQQMINRKKVTDRVRTGK